MYGLIEKVKKQTNQISIMIERSREQNIEEYLMSLLPIEDTGELMEFKITVPTAYIEGLLLSESVRIGLKDNENLETFINRQVIGNFAACLESSEINIEKNGVKENLSFIQGKEPVFIKQEI